MSGRKRKPLDPIKTTPRSLWTDGKFPIFVFDDYHFGGYAKYQTSLISFMNTFFEQTHIPSDFVYTGKLFYAINDLVSKKYFPDQSRLLLTHSGGLQGNHSLSKGTLIF